MVERNRQSDDGPLFAVGDVACTLDESDARERSEWIEADLLPHLVDVEEITDGYEFVFERSPEAFAVVSKFIRVESNCCSDLWFEVTVPPGSDVLSLSVTGPRGTQELFDRAMAEYVEDVAEMV